MRSGRVRPTSRFGPRAGTAALLAVPLLLTGLAAGAPAGAEAHPGRVLPGRVVLPGTVPAWAAPTADRGEIAPSAPVTVRVYLAGRDRAGLEALATAVSDPTSPSHARFLTARQVRERFGATPQQSTLVRDWLTTSGFDVVATTPRFLSVRGDAAAVRKAFGIPLHDYSKDGRTFHAPPVPATVPAAVASAVLSVTGLDNAPHTARPGTAGPDAVRTDPAPARGADRAGTDRAGTDSAGTVRAGSGPVGAGRREMLPPPAGAVAISGPFSPYFGAKPATGTPPAYGKVQPYALTGYTGAQLRRAYGVPATGATGAGVTVAVVDAYDSPTIGVDTAAYSAAHGEAAYRPGQLTRIGPEDWSHTADFAPGATPDGCGAAGWYGEQSLDIEAVHGVAPDANILYSAGASCQDDDLADALSRIVDNRLADIVSNSWGEPESESSPAADPVYDDIFMRGAVEGIGFYVATGDDGDYAASVKAGRQSGMPASLPWVTAVGGTSLATDRNGDYSFETGWGTDKASLSTDGTSWGALPGTFSSGGGGGTSKRVPEPLYQYSAVPKALAAINGGLHRVIPDVAAVADSGTGFLVGQTQTWPDNSVHYGEYRIGGTSLATPVFSAIQALAQQAQNGVPLGFANPALYARYGTAAYHDVTDTPLGANTTLAMVRTDFHNGVNADNGLDTSLRTMGHDSSLHAVKGFDAVTGVGSPTAGYLASYLPGFAGFGHPGGAPRP